MKKILISAAIVLSIFVIYLCNMDKKVYYLALGDSSLIGDKNGYTGIVKTYLDDKNILEKYVDGFIRKDYLSYDLIKDIQNNNTVTNGDKKISIQNALIKADLVTLSIGNYDIFNKINARDPDYNGIYNYIDDLSNDLDSLFKLMRQYCKEDIILIGYYNPYGKASSEKVNAVYDYLNDKFKSVCAKYEVAYVQINHLFEENPTFLENNVPNHEGYKAIAGEVIGTINKTIFKA